MMTEREVVDWYADVRDLSWIFPKNTRVINLIEPDTDLPEPVIIETCKDCYVKKACYDVACRFHEAKSYEEFQTYPTCEQYISAKEVEREEETS